MTAPGRSTQTEPDGHPGPPPRPADSTAPTASGSASAPAARFGRRRLSTRHELLLALFPTLVVILVLFLVERFSHQRLLFSSLASSAFLIYLDPEHGTNQASTLFRAQGLAALVGALALTLLGPGYVAAGLAMASAIALMVSFNIVHPPAASTAISFAFRYGDESTLVLFGMALAMIVVLLVMERVTLRLLLRLTRHAHTGVQAK